MKTYKTIALVCLFAALILTTAFFVQSFNYNTNQFTVNAPYLSISDGAPFTNTVVWNSFTVNSTNSATHFGGSADATNGFLLRIKYIGNTNYAANGTFDAYVGTGTNQQFTLPNGTNGFITDGRVYTIASGTNNGSILVTNANGVQLIAGQQSLLIPGGQSSTFAWSSAIGQWVGASLTGLLSGSNYWTGPQTFAGTVTAGSATFTNPVFINPVSLTNAAIVSSTNYGTVGETNYTWTDANGWWHTNTGSKSWAHFQNGQLTVSNGVTGVQFKTPTNSPTATATNLVATSTAGDTAWASGTSTASPILGGVPSGLNFTTSARYVPITSASSGVSTESNVSQPSGPGTYSSLYVRFAGLGSGTNATVTLMTNGVASNLSVSIIGTGGNIIGVDTTDTVTVPDQCTVSYKMLGNNTTAPASTVLMWTSLNFTH